MSEKTGGFFARSNEPCAGKTDDSRKELAHIRMADGLDAYGERRDSPKPKAEGLVGRAHEREEIANEKIFTRS